ncbi:MAG: helix-turn-helix domain-containing protein [Jatrophihabitantaceae bacterium]
MTTAQQLPRGRHQLSREQITGFQRDRMLRAMAEAMAERGYVGTPVAEIIRRAGVSRETFYQQFGSKQDCFVAALETALGRLSAAMEHTALTQGSALERFDRLIGIYLEALAAEPATARLFLIEIYAAGPDVMKRRSELQLQFVDGLVEIFHAHTEQGRFACQALMAAIISMVTTHIAAGDVAALRALRAPLVELVRCAPAALISGR